MRADQINSDKGGSKRMRESERKTGVRKERGENKDRNRRAEDKVVEGSDNRNRKVEKNIDGRKETGKSAGAETKTGRIENKKLTGRKENVRKDAGKGTNGTENPDRMKGRMQQIQGRENGTYWKTGGNEKKKVARKNDSAAEHRNRGGKGPNKEAKQEIKRETKNEKSKDSGNLKCPVFRKCGGCQHLDIPYEKQLEQKRKKLEELLQGFCPVKGMIGMEQPYHYRNKVHAVFDRDKKGNPISGVYKADSHIVVPVESCLIEDQKADEIIGTIRGMLKSFKIRTFDEDTGYGFLRHVLVKKGFATGEIMVVLITASPVFPSKNNFVKALREKHPEITTIIQNVNNRFTNMVLGDRENVLYGKGYIEDTLCGCTFRISSKSFYQVNPVQTEKLYQLAIEKAGLTGKETVIDAYCGIGTIGIIASSLAKQVIGVELNKDAVKDAIINAKLNAVTNVQFYCNDAGKFMRNMAEQGEKADVVFMDPPRSGSTEEFIDSLAMMRPDRVVYISCGPETLARDLWYFKKKGYVAREGWGVDLFPWTGHVETVTLLVRKP